MPDPLTRYDAGTVSPRLNPFCAVRHYLKREIRLHARRLWARMHRLRPDLIAARALLRPFPDWFYLSLGYLCYFGTWPNYRRPRNFNEHIHAYMLRCRNPLLKVAGDKLKSREWISQTIGSQYLVPLIGAWDSAGAVPIEQLPRPCVLKPSVGSGKIFFLLPGKDDAEYLRAEMRRWQRKDYSRTHREWCYLGERSRILAEPMLMDETGAIPADYKAYVIGGKVRFIQVDRNRFSRHTRNLYSVDWQLLPARLTLANHPVDERPQCLEEIIQVAQTLAQHFEFLRVDFYWVNARLYIGELTNYPGAGFERFIPHSFSLELGSHWKL